MKSLVLLYMLAAAGLMAQPDIRVHAQEIQHNGGVTVARGDATLSNSTVQIKADSITYNAATGEAQATGNVRIKFVTANGTSGQLQTAPRPSLEERLKLMRERQRFPPEIVR